MHISLNRNYSTYFSNHVAIFLFFLLHTLHEAPSCHKGLSGIFSLFWVRVFGSCFFFPVFIITLFSHNKKLKTRNINASFFVSFSHHYFTNNEFIYFEFPISCGNCRSRPRLCLSSHSGHSDQKSMGGCPHCQSCFLWNQFHFCFATW